MMCFPSIDSLVKKVDSKYTLVTLAALRARELNDGQPALIPGVSNKKPVTIALEEVYNDKITYSFRK
ncbi:DNA-directed RNA polymerase subunit omega [Dialister sp.]|jgi:DNA-directed RNA polymerase subunit omega|uniref:DNA-directed RNA polymerase subunit omega n=1 Tax=Dialister sp. TaxID=1955814 RepID=UPI002E8138AC|nr:DNA-directed RNA polymerase subunit omega [Dialister sp.]MEE3452039.1 DNA-directed RNA polymerase subunit omega [Dialister sp.]